MVEQPGNMYCVGVVEIENIKNISLMSSEELEEYLGFSVRRLIFMVMFSGNWKEVIVQCVCNKIHLQHILYT